MFRRILIANRGEIACRIIKTAKKFCIPTVAIYSDADANALHVEMADEAFRVGPAPVAESYLRGDKIIEIALAAKVHAIHPGYGFFSENPEFVEAVENAGIRFIGPSATAIRAMGLKDAAKQLMTEAGVPVVPGYHGDNQDAAFLAREAEKIGYPVLIKARAGGGGKGMRRVDDPRMFLSALEGAQREAASSFGDARCLIEKYVSAPRHIEIQIFGDDHGNVVHLFERDCSLQRRHQKVIEEAPAPGITEDVRRAMGEAAVKAARAIGYSGAGTVEFIVDASEGLRADRFYFMEMNTRLQVEHPVTECITGLDLVEWQLRIASGESLPLRQEELSINGWAFEARIYSEDVPKGFLPATGRLDYVSLPEEIARIDSGVQQGDEVTPFYDPMIAKLIVHGANRQSALAQLSASLDRCHIAGSVTNIAFLKAISIHPGFMRGEVDTGLIERDLDVLIAKPAPDKFVWAIAALAALGYLQKKSGSDPWENLSGWQLWSQSKQFAFLSYESSQKELAVTALTNGLFEVSHVNETITICIRSIKGPVISVAVDNHIFCADFVKHDSSVTVFFNGDSYLFKVPDRLADEDEGDAGGDRLIAPMPGLVKKLFGSAGASVSKGDKLIILEAMKMEHTLSAPRDGIIGEIFVSEGEQTDEGALLMLIADAEPAA